MLVFFITKILQLTIRAIQVHVIGSVSTLTFNSILVLLGGISIYDHFFDDFAYYYYNFIDRPCFNSRLQG